MNGELVLEKTVKRDGVITDFLVEKIDHAMFKTMCTVGGAERVKPDFAKPNCICLFSINNQLFFK